MAGKPLWRRAFDGVERRLAGPLESGVQSDLFADTVTLLVRAHDRLGRELERRTGGMLGMVNLPAGSDVKRLSRQVASLERQVRQLSKQLEDEREAADGARPRSARAGSASRAAGSRPRRRSSGASARRRAGGDSTNGGTG